MKTPSGKLWVGIYSAVTIIMAAVSFATKCAYKIPDGWGTIFLGAIGVYSVTNAKARAIGKYWIDSRYNTVPGQAPGQDTEV